MQTEGKAFRYDISFLRFIAVLSVLFYHYNIIFFSGGFIGVDIFFVISGFLMTKIILTGFERHNFSLKEFYYRRAVRILPALLFMILFFLIVIYFFLPTQLTQYLRNAYASSLFFSNVYYYVNSGYFDVASYSNFLLHTWSLSVEWQFYLIYPLLLLVIRKIYCKNKLYALVFILILASISFFSMVYFNQEKLSFSFFMTFTRAWEMLIGGIAFFVPPRIKGWICHFKLPLLIFSYLTLVYLVVFANSYSWPSFYTILPVLSTFAILSINKQYKIYSNKLVKYVGDLSYSLYLYHWPLFVLSMFYGLNVKIEHRATFLCFSIILAVMSYHTVEKFRYHKRGKMVLISTLFVFLVTFSFSKISPEIYLNGMDGTLANVESNYRYSEQAKMQYNLDSKHYSGTPKFETFNRDFLIIPSNDKPNIVLLGDSHAGMFAKTINNITEDLNCNLIQITADGTFPIANSSTAIIEGRKYFNFIFNEYFPRNKSKIDLVIVSSNYSAYEEEDLKKRMRVLLDFFKNNQVKTLFLGQTNTYVQAFPTYYFVVKKQKFTYIEEERRNAKLSKTNTIMNNMVTNDYIDLMRTNIKMLSSDNMPYMYDQNHLTYYGAEQYKEVIRSYIKSRLGS